MRGRKNRERFRPSFRGFTLLELLVVMAIISTIASFVFGRISGVLEKARMSRASVELTEISKATYQYVIDAGGAWPADVDRAIPPGVEAYLGPGNWPDAPWPGTVYDWDAFVGSDGKQVYQISIRFCPIGHPELCTFPDEDWAEDFDYYSSAYHCIQGKCRSHPSMPDTHPGHCLNCPSS
jgi:prepilin-type N-terminal cleavage/methylation domain-containing protein